MLSDEVLFAIYFLYGLAFFSMGLLLLLETWRLEPNAPQQELLRPLAVFGLIHGAHEWLEIFIIQSTRLAGQLADAWQWVRVVMLALSFLALWSYSLNAYRYGRGHITPLNLFGAVTLPLFAVFATWDMLTAFTSGRIPLAMFSEGLVRYTLGVTGAAIATLGLRAAALKARADGRRPLDTYLTIAALGFALYSISQVFVPSMDTILANLLNAELFRASTNIPIQAVRTFAAIVITTGMFYGTRFLEGERQAVVAAAQQERLKALEQQQALRRELLQHTVRAQEDERAHLARELHDEMAQILTAFSLDLGTLQQIFPNSAKAAPVLKRLQDLSRQMSQGIYQMVRSLRPAHLDELGLEAALRYMIELEFRPRGLAVILEIDGEARWVAPLAETVLFRIAQEALSNVQRHAQATETRVCLCYEKDSVCLRVSDNGQGFDPSQTFSAPHGWGLAGMQERAESMGGRLRVESALGKGASVEVFIPCGNSQGDE
jgi:signal transduction histidine kinase